MITSPHSFSASLAGRTALAAVTAAALLACGAPASGGAYAQGAPETTYDQTALQPTIPADCSTPTPAETEGPYFTPGSPEESTLATTGTPGTLLTLTGYVVDTNCQPLVGALVDFWQANANGQYDNSGYTLRGHQYTDANGMYQLVTVVPGLYPGRTRHIHVKVEAPGQDVLTTQLYFPDEPANSRDGVFRDGGQSLLMTVQQQADGSEQATYTFIVPAQ